MAHGGILCVLGTRPEAIKLAPVILALGAAEVVVVVCLTGQHPALARAALAEFGIAPDIDLGLLRPGQQPAAFVAAALPPLARVIAEAAPALVVVHGDTASTLAGALAARYARLPLARRGGAAQHRSP